MPGKLYLIHPKNTEEVRDKNMGIVRIYDRLLFTTSKIHWHSDSGAVEHGLAYRVVFDLLKEYLDKSILSLVLSYVCFDNFYTSLKLLPDLLLRKIFACGTVRVDRGDFPKRFKYAKLENGDSKFIKNDDIFAVNWKDKRDVLAMSSVHGNGTELVQRRGENNNITKPSMILEYNKYMNGVDKCD